MGDYSEKLKSLKKDILFSKDSGATLGDGIEKDELIALIKRFCSPEEACLIRHEDLYKVFDEFCTENNYPIINRRTLGRHFCEALGLTRKKALMDGRLCWVYIKKPED